MNLQTLKSYQLIRSNLKDITSTGADCISGKITLSKDIVGQLNILDNQGLIISDSLLIGGDDVGISDIEETDYGQISNIEIVTHKHEDNYLICDSWRDILSNETLTKNPLDGAYIHSKKDVLFPSIDIFDNYIKISKVCEFIDQVALNTTGQEGHIHFERTLTIEYLLREEDLEHPIEIKALDSMLHKDLHLEAKINLVCQELIRFFKDCSSNKRFSYLINNFGAFSSNVLLAYQGYCENYTFDKVRREYQEKRTDYIERVNKTFDDISLKLLSIPAGVLFAASKVKGNEGISLASNNLAIFTSMTILSFLMVFTLLGQFSTLNALRTEYKALFDRLLNSYSEESEALIKAKEDIEHKAVWVYVKLSFSLVFVFFLVLVTCITIF